MASETKEGASMTVALPADLDEWLDERADELGVDRETVLVQLLAAYRVAADIEDETAIDELADQLTESEETLADAAEQAIESDELDLTPYIEEELEPLESDVEDLEDRVAEQFDEVKRRLVQVKQATDEKAPADHTHEELDQFPELLDQFESLRQTVGELQTVLEEGQLTDRLDALEDDTDQLRARLNTVASALVGLRSRVSVAASARQETLTEIRQRAAAEGIERAQCENCEKRVTVGLLAEPECPHCGAEFASIEPSDQLFFGAASLITSRTEREGTNE